MGIYEFRSAKVLLWQHYKDTEKKISLRLFPVSVYLFIGQPNQLNNSGPMEE